jgi:hypothetical protein
LDGSKEKTNASKHQTMSLLRALNGPKSADPGNNCLISKDSQGESQEELVPKRPSAETPPVTL